MNNQLDLSQYERTDGFWKYIYEEGDEVQIDSRKRPDNEGAEHFFKKVFLCHQFHKHDFSDIKMEDSTHRNLRYDVSAITPTEKRIVCEIGELNVKSEDLHIRLKRTYKDSDCLIWWPYSIEERTRYLADGWFQSPFTDSEKAIRTTTNAPFGLEGEIQPLLFLLTKYYEED